MPRMMNVTSGHFLRDIPLRALQRKVGDERVNLLQACYDNPLFTEEDDRDQKGSSSSSRVPLPAHDGRLPGAKDYLHTLPPGGAGGGIQTLPEIRFGEKKRRRRTVKLFFCLLVAVVFAIVIGLTVHFLQAPTSSHLRTTSAPVISLSSKVQGCLTIIDGPYAVYKREYTDNTSSAYYFLLKSLQFKMEQIFEQSSFKDMYKKTDLLRVRADMTLTFVIFFRELRHVTSAEVQQMKSLIEEGFESSIIVIKKDSVTLQADVILPRTTSRPPEEHCEELNMPTCLNGSVHIYYRAAFPNFLGHPTQDIAEQSLLTVLNTLKTSTCHNYVNTFLCALFAPECGTRTKPIPPCRSFCQGVMTDCHVSFQKVGISLPVDCEIFPESRDPSVCLSNPYSPGKCLRNVNSMCHSLGFNESGWPNVVGQDGDGQASYMLILYKGLMEATGCYKHGLLFGCAAYFPPCSGNTTLGYHHIPPCKSLCYAFKNRCEIFLDIFNTPWPEELNCETLPDSPDPAVCLGYSEAHEPTVLAECMADERRCDETRCIQNSWVCDGYQDCQDRSDENSCAVCHPYETVCSPVSMLCINTTDVCDGDDHCYEGVDEADCLRLGEGNDTRVLQSYNPVTKEWEEVCSKDFNQTFALLACKQLGYRHSSCPGDDYVVKLTCWEPVCGNRPAKYESVLRVVGGDEVKPGTWPWMVSMHGGSDQKFFCGASVIDAEWVLTAGHCVGGGIRDTEYWTLIAGHTRRPSYSPYRQVRKPRQLFVHPEYDPLAVNNDIALIRLQQPFQFSDFLRPVCLPQAEQEIPMGTRCFVAGWGKTATFALHYEAAIREVNLDVVTWESCSTAVSRSHEDTLHFKLTTNMFCAGGAGGHDACQGDSGGPLMCRMANATDLWFQAGIVSWGISCAQPNAPGIYTKLPLYVSWIQEVMANNSRS